MEIRPNKTVKEARDEFDRLICPVPGCGRKIQAWTGLQELEKLRAHMRRAHLANWSPSDTLENRARIENRGRR